MPKPLISKLMTPGFYDLTPMEIANLFAGSPLGWGTSAASTLKPLSASKGRVEFEWTITEEMCNLSGNLHGGCAVTVFDIATTICTLTIAAPGFMDGGNVTRSFTCSFLLPVQEGSKVRMICEVVRGGKRFSLSKGEIRTADDQVAVIFTHDKVEMPRPKL